MRKAMDKIKKAKTQEGFTLLEVMVAISILSIGLLAVASMQVAAIQGNFHANGVTTATALAQDTLEDLTALPYTVDVTDPDLALGSHPDSPAPNSAGYTIRWTVTDDATLNAKTITVTVTWQDKGVTKTTALTTIKSQL